MVEHQNGHLLFSSLDELKQTRDVCTMNSLN